MTSTKDKNVPKLRFPGFTDEWHVKTLSDIADFFDGKRVPIESAERQTMQGDYPYYGASGVIDFVNDYIFDGEYVLLAEDGANILMRSTPIAFIASGKFWLNNHAHIMKAHGSNIFLATYLEQLKYDNYNTGTTQPKLNAAVVKKIKIVLPSGLEQEIIAGFLTAIDDRITAIDKKVELLKQYKKGAMRKIFTQQIRFKAEGDKSYNHWEECRLEYYAASQKNAIVDGPFGSQMKVDDFVGTGFPVLEMEHLTNKTEIRKPTRFISAEKLKQVKRSAVYPGDILLSKTGTIGLLGIAGETINPGIITSRLAKITLDTSKSVISFIFYYLYYLNYVGYWDSVSQGGTMKILGTKAIKECKIPLVSYDEQQAIADFLAAIDDKIKAQESKLTMAKNFKKALLQRMFV